MPAESSTTEIVEEWIGWTYFQCDRHLSLVANNSRFLILSKCSVPNLGSRVLRLSADTSQQAPQLRRYENRSTIMTSNRPIQEWGQLLGDVPSASAILDRFLHHVQTIAITGRTYRQKDQPANRSPGKPSVQRAPHACRKDTSFLG